MNDRDKMTVLFLKQWGISTDGANVKFYSLKWWVSNRVNNKSFRLTSEGLQFLVDTLGLRSYNIPFTESIEKSPQTVIYLCRFIDSPFYLTNNSITVFSELKSVELMMFAEDIRKYGILKALNARQKNTSSNKNG